MIKVVAFTAALMCIIPSRAQESKGNAFVELGPVVGFSEGSQASLSLQGGYLWNVGSNASIGFVAGVNSSLKFDTAPSIPLGIRAKYNFGDNNVTPFASMDLGYNLNLEDFENGTIQVTPTIGVNLSNYYVGAGYVASIPTGDGDICHGAIFKVGYNFDSGNTVLTNFIRHTYLKFEVGYGLGLTSKTFEANGTKEISKGGSDLFARLTWLYNIDDNWSAGIGSGLDVYWYDLKNHHSVSRYLSVPIYARGQYKFFDKDATMRPFVSCDLGGRFNMSDEENQCTGIMFEPQVGVEYHRMSISVGCAMSKHTLGPDKYNNGKFGSTRTDINTSNVNVRLGVRL